MPRKFAIEFVDQLLMGDSYADLVELASAICSWPQYDPKISDYGLPRFAFAFAETLGWFAQTIRSGSVTYYEVAPLERQAAMAFALRAEAPEGFADWYERGTRDWREPQKLQLVDEWVEASAEAANVWLHNLARRSREAILTMT